MLNISENPSHFSGNRKSRESFTLLTESENPSHFWPKIVENPKSSKNWKPRIPLNVIVGSLEINKAEEQLPSAIKNNNNSLIETQYPLPLNLIIDRATCARVKSWRSCETLVLCRHEVLAKSWRWRACRHTVFFIHARERKGHKAGGARRLVMFLLWCAGPAGGLVPWHVIRTCIKYCK